MNSLEISNVKKTSIIEQNFEISATSGRSYCDKNIT